MKFAKIIYFDEGSAADYLQILSGGVLKKTTEFIADVNRIADGKGQVDADFNSKKGLPVLFNILSGAGIEASVKGSAEIQSNKAKIAKTILENTLLTDFVETIDADNKKKEENRKHTAIKQFEKVSLRPENDTFSYYMLMAPYFTMFEGKIPIQDENSQDYELDISKIEDAISRGRGYYEFIANIDGREKIFRFNSEAFRNNYTFSDLPKMELSLYAVFVGRIDKDKLSLSNEFEFGMEVRERFVYDEKLKIEDNKLDVYDVLLAGVTG